MSHESARQVQLRRDLEHSHQLQQGRSYLVVKDPVTRRYFRFTEAQASIIEIFKGEPKDCESIAALASDKLNTIVSTSTIEAFCKSLEEKFLLETPEVREKLGAIRGQQLEARNFLYWKIASVDPERIFAWLLPRTRWAFKPSFQIMAVLAIFTGFTITWLNWRSLSGAAPALFSVYGLLLIWPVMFTVTTIHEFSHGLTCCHYGGKVHEVGFMLIYFSPAFYCDVSDSYMFPKRTNRMAVALAGGFAQLTVWGVCTMIWRITDTNAYINKLVFIVVVFSGLQTLVNFNPLIKLDGYYMLSDFLEVPNLRGKALRSLWDWIAGNGKSSWSIREMRAQLVYGAASAVFSISLLVYVYSALYTWATSKYALAGLIVFGIFANFTLRKALVEPMEGVKAVAARASVKRYRNIAILVAALILTVIVHWELKVSAPFKILPSDESIVTAETQGVVDEIRVKEGDVVHKGQLLARVSDFERNDLARNYFGQLQTAKEQLKVMRNGTRPEAIAVQEELITGKKVELANVYRNKAQRAQLQASLEEKNLLLSQKQQESNRNQDLFSAGLISKDLNEKSDNATRVAREAVRAADEEIHAFDEKAENDATRIMQEIAEAEKDLALMKAGSRPDEIEKAEADVARLEGVYDNVSRDLKKSDIIAKIDGTVMTEYVERKVGTHLDAGGELMRLADTSTVNADMMVPEKELGDVHLGLPVRIQLASLPTRYFEGKVDFIAQAAHASDGQQVVTVRSYLSNPDGVLKPELTGIAKIYCGPRRIIEIMTRRIGMWIRTEFWGLRP
jgi:multidrug efflux pump subunit AcrA (membrane-fusion protein)